MSALRLINAYFKSKRASQAIHLNVLRKFSVKADDFHQKNSSFSPDREIANNLTVVQRETIEEITKNLGHDLSMKSFLHKDALDILELSETGIYSIDHPKCQEIARNFQEITKDEDYVVRLPSVISLLYAMAVATKKNNQLNEDEVFQKQTTISQIGVMGRSALMFHKHIQTYDPLPETHEKESLEKCNKILILAGDLLCGLSSKMCGSLRNCEVLLQFSNLISNLTEEEFTWGKENTTDQKLAYLVGKSQWEYRTHLAFASAIQNITISCLEMADHDETSLLKAKEFGKNIACTIQAYRDISRFISFDQVRNSDVDLLSLPVAIHLKKNPDFILDFFTWGNKKEAIDSKLIWKSINQNGSLEDALAAFRTYKKSTLNSIQNLPNTKSSQLLVDFILSYDADYSEIVNV